VGQRARALQETSPSPGTLTTRRPRRWRVPSGLAHDTGPLYGAARVDQKKTVYDRAAVTCRAAPRDGQAVGTPVGWRPTVDPFPPTLLAGILRQMPSLTPRERWQLGLAVLTAFVGPEDRRAADITSVVGDQDPREILFGVLAVTRDLLGLLEAETGAAASDLLQALAERGAG
jgi:hypothetical protein